MKKLLMGLVLVGTFAAVSAKGDSYIYWMASNDNDAISQYGADSASLIAKSGDNVYDIGFATVSGESPATESRVISDMLPAQVVADPANWTFYVELWKDDWNLGTSGEYSWAQLKGMDAIYQSTLTGGLGTAQFANFTYNVPEPTSGLLVLLGMCGLALKRKRV